MRLDIPDLPGALCAETDPELFFPEKGGSVLKPRQICMACDVRADCLQWAIDHDERAGVWGGLSPKERLKLAKRRAA